VCRAEPSIHLANGVAITEFASYAPCTYGKSALSPGGGAGRFGRAAAVHPVQGSNSTLQPAVPLGSSCEAGTHSGTGNASHLHSPRVRHTVQCSRRVWLQISHPAVPAGGPHAASISAFFLSASLVTSSVTVVARAWISFICRNTSSLDMPGPARGMEGR